jgi:hypothetical protein
VSDIANGCIVVMNPDNPASANVFPVQTTSDKTAGVEPTSLVALTNSVYFIMGGSLRQLDLGTGVVTTVVTPNSTAPHDRVVRTGDGSLLAANFEGYMVVVNTNTGAVSNPFSANANDSADLAVSADGTHFVEYDLILDSNAHISGAVAYSDAEVQDVSAIFGQKFLSSGSLLFQPLTNQVDVINTNTGRLRHRVSLPISISNTFDATVLDEPDNKLFLITNTGIAALPLDQLPVGLGSLDPSQTASGGGATIQVNGNGFVSGAEVAVDGESIGVIFVDQETLQIVAPAHAPGGVQIVITNPDGEQVSVDDALTYTGTASAANKSKDASGNKRSKTSSRTQLAVPLCRLTRAGEPSPNSCEAIRPR